MTFVRGNMFQNLTSFIIYLSSYQIFIARQKTSSSTPSPTTSSYFTHIESSALQRFDKFHSQSNSSSIESQFNPLPSTTSASDRSRSRNQSIYGTKDRYSPVFIRGEQESIDTRSSSLFTGKDANPDISPYSIEPTRGERMQYK